MSADFSDPLWPRFWSDVPESDRAPMREVLAELLGRGVLLGDEGGGRDLFLLARDHYRTHLEDYLARNWEAARHSVGCYMLEEEGIRLFETVDGDYFSVLGLPLLPLHGYLGMRGFIPA